MAALREEVKRLGLELGAEALAALESLPLSHATELLQATEQKYRGGTLKDPTNYICATVNRGYMPRSGSQSQGPPGVVIGAGGGGGGKGGPPAPRSSNYEAAAAALIATQGMQKAEAAGLSLSDEAVQALLKVPASHASEILEAVAEKHTELRDPSNYVVATISRGYVPRSENANYGKGAGYGSGKSGSGGGSLYESIYGRGSRSGYDDYAQGSGKGCGGGYGYGTPIGGGSSYGAKGYGGPGYGGPGYGGPGYGYGGPGYGSMGSGWGGKDSGKGSRGGGGLLPDDLTVLERAVLDLNEQDLWMGQEISPSTLLSLRCISQEDALELLNNLQGKGMSKGSKSITSLNNYVQAAISKIVREGGAGKGAGAKNRTGNQSRQKAEELGLILEETTYETLAHMPLRRALALIEQGAQKQSEGEDPNSFIEGEAYAENSSGERALKRGRWDV